MEKDSDKKHPPVAFRRKSFNELSDVAQFHLAPKLFGEDAQWPFYESEAMMIRGEIGQNVLKKNELAPTLSTPEGRHMEGVIHEALGVELGEAGEKDPVERRKLESCKDRIRKYTEVVLESIKIYMGTILYLEETVRRGYVAEVEKADENRKLAHNALIENINILNRSLVWWFGKFDPSELSDAQMAMYEKQEESFISHHVRRIDIPSNGICPIDYSIANRNEINRWAKAIYKDLIAIQRLSGLVD